ncbi:hypothetical protein G6F22_022126 [Rhizopus arrhizus]|nr:hypothetical protein G6F22_022126 [Rhizopus arrhizus]
MLILVIKIKNIDSRVVQKSFAGQIGGWLNDIMKFDGHISSKDEAVVAPPEHLPEQVEATSEKVLHA